MAPPILCLVGPTGVGKTALALALARRHQGQVVNADSRQVYRGLALVTAQPTPAEQAVCPHHLYGFLNPDEAISAGEFAKLAHGAIDQGRSRGGLPLLVGGTGLYLEALLHGLATIPDIPPAIRQRFQERCRAQGPEALHAELTALDPEYAGRIHPRDRQRITRALEVQAATGRTFSAWHAAQAATPPRYRALKIGVHLPPEELHPRLATRIQAMLEAGAEAEMELALAQWPQEDAPGYSGIGCRELIDLLRGRLTRDQALARWLARTKAYAKRQMTWFRADPTIHWFRPGESDRMLSLVDDWLQEQG